jgi:NAD(P)-dependent dehydrogenase (short-subunit alcohol dehydrogenase family)
MSGLHGKTLVVTGAGAGIGQGSALFFAREGALVCCVDRDGGAAERTARLIGKNGGRALAAPVDITSEDDLRTMVDKVMSVSGRIDGLFANAGIFKPGGAIGLPLEEWNEVIGVNLTGVFLTVREVLPVMVRQGSGSIVTLASVAGMIGHRKSAAYAASKGGVIALTRQLAADHARTGIRINAVCPGTVRTALAESAYARAGAPAADAELMFERVGERYPAGRLGEVNDVAALVSFLLGDGSRWITGAAYPVDGGLTACY